MAKPVASWKRIADAQHHLLQRAEADLARLRRRETAIIAEQAALLNALDTDVAFAHLYIEHRARQAKILEKELVELRRRIMAAEMQVQEQARRDHGAKKKLAEAEQAHRAAVERADLQEIIEASLSRGRASLP